MIHINKIVICFFLFVFSALSLAEKLSEADGTAINDFTNHKKIKYEDLEFSYSDHRDDLFNSLISACPFFKGDTDHHEHIYESLHYQSLDVTIPRPGNIDQNLLPKSKKISLIISGSSPNPEGKYSKTQKLVCLNHLAYAYSRGIPAYRFLNTLSFSEELEHLPPHWLKVAALKYYLPQIKADQWVMWVDDDVVTSDFTSSLPLTDEIINFMVKPQDTKSPSIILTTDPNTGINTGILLVRNSKEGRDYIEHWWETRIDDIHPKVFDAQGTPYYCAKTGLHYKNYNSCSNVCHIETETYHPLISSDNDDVANSLDYSSCLYESNYSGWKPLSDHDQTSLYRMHLSLPSSPRLYGNRFAINALLYEKSHVLRSIQQKMSMSCGSYRGFNTFINCRELALKAKAFSPYDDLWVQAPGLGSDVKERSTRLNEWLRTINSIYPIITNDQLINYFKK